VVACFTDDAVVLDEDQEWRGEVAIRQWREKVANAYEYTVEVRGAAQLGSVDDVQRHDVHTHLEGNFPGGTVDLTFRFGLRDGRIATLQIVPTETAS
jgi:hypothetical protein